MELGNQILGDCPVYDFATNISDMLDLEQVSIYLHFPTFSVRSRKVQQMSTQIIIGRFYHSKPFILFLRLQRISHDYNEACPCSKANHKDCSIGIVSVIRK